MAQPTPFNRQTSFAQFSANYPNKPQNGGSLDAEFNAVKVSLDETQQNLRLVQDDDGALKRGSVGRSQLDSSITLGFATPKPWTAETFYEADISTVFYQAKFYSCVETHSSTETFEPSKWFEIADLSASAAIDPGSITEDKLADGAVGPSKLGTQAVSTSKIATGAVTNGKLAADAVTFSKLDSSVYELLANVIIPAGLGPLPWSGSVAPVGWVFLGATYLRADYPVLWAHAAAEIAAGNQMFTAGNGTTTFTIRNVDGTVSVAHDPSSTRVTGATVLGSVIGNKETTLATGNLPPYTPTGDVGSLFSGSGTVEIYAGGAAAAGGAFTAMTQGSPPTAVTVSGTVTSTFTGNAQGGLSTPISRVQPGVVTKFIMKAH